MNFSFMNCIFLIIFFFLVWVVFGSIKIFYMFIVFVSFVIFVRVVLIKEFRGVG